MIIVNLPNIPGQKINPIQMVTANIVYCKNFGKDIMASLKNLVGGEVASYTEMIDDGKKSVIEKLKKEAMDIGADAVLNVQFSITNLSQGSALVILATGTAVEFIEE